MDSFGWFCQNIVDEVLQFYFHNQKKLSLNKLSANQKLIICSFSEYFVLGVQAKGTYFYNLGQTCYKRKPKMDAFENVDKAVAPGPYEVD